jgi:hypothetical protein
MPPLTTPPAAVLFMFMFFVLMMGVPLMILRLAHHRIAHPIKGGHTAHRRYNLILPE